MGKRKVKKPLSKRFRDIGEYLYDRTRYALVTIHELLSRPKYLACFFVTLLIFLFVLNFFKDGDGNWQLICSGLPLERKFVVLGRVCISVFTSLATWYGLSILLMSTLQALVIILLIFAWRKRKKDSVLDGASTGGIGAIFGFIALGCPSCGVGLLTPILTTLAGAGAMAMAETISGIFTILAFLLLFFTVIRLGYINFVTISSEKATKPKKEEKDAKSH